MKERERRQLPLPQSFKESIVDDKDLGEDNETVLEDRKQDEAAAATKKKREEEALQSSYRTQKKAKRMKIKNSLFRKESNDRKGKARFREDRG